MKICIIGHETTIKKMTDVIKDEEYLEIHSLAFNTVEQKEGVIKYLKTEESHYDGIIFTGKIPYVLINQAILSKNPWAYLEYDISSLYHALFHAASINKWSLERISIDSFEEKTVEIAFKDLSIPYDVRKIRTACFDIYNDQFLNQLTQFHIENYRSKGISFCITGITAVYEKLIEENIPTIKLHVTDENIRKVFQILKLKKELNLNKMSQIVVLDIEIDNASDFSQDEYHRMLEHSIVSKEIYHFAQEIQAAISVESKEKFLLFGTKNIVELATDNYTKLSLIDSVNKNTNSTISIGIGYGTTAREAKHAAERGRRRAKKHGGNQAYVVKSNEYIGPMKPSRHKNHQNELHTYWQIVSDKAGISVNNIYKVHNAILRLGKDSYAPKELADQIGITLRSMNRLIEKLDKAGYVEVLGKKIVGQAGRPSRIIKIKI